MNTRRLRRFLADLEERRDVHRELGDEQGAERLEHVLGELRDVADRLDEVLKRLGDPPTDR